MIHFTANELEQYISEDLPYLDLTTHLQGIENTKVSLEVFTREDIIVSCMQEACAMVKMLNCDVNFYIKSKQKAHKNDVILQFSGEYNDVHKAWRSAQVILEYSCKIATYAYNMKQEILKVNQHCELLTTRKTFPFSKKFCIKSILTGGAMPHRLNLSETILFFPHHRIVYKNDQEFYQMIQNFKIKTPEKKVVVESDKLQDAKQLMRYGADVLQMDKVNTTILEQIVGYKNTHYPTVKILAAGGIGLHNAQEYAKTGIDGIVTSKVYMAGMADLGTKMKLLV
ncbi:MAG: ModD protein [Arcobacteraceae bacterium]